MPVEWLRLELLEERGRLHRVPAKTEQVFPPQAKVVAVREQVRLRDSGDFVA